MKLKDISTSIFMFKNHGTIQLSYNSACGISGGVYRNELWFLIKHLFKAYLKLRKQLKQK